MAADGIVQRQVFPEVPPRVEYRLTELGQSMDPILKAMHNWGNQYLASHPEKNKTNKQPETDFAQKRP